MNNQHPPQVFVQDLVAKFREHFLFRSYAEYPAVPISSGIDPTVRFVGSHISVFKPFVLREEIPPSGLFMVQPCLRTHNLSRFLNPGFFPNWGSYFPSLGTLVPGIDVSRAASDLFSLLLESFEVPVQNIALRVSAADHDLLELCRAANPQLLLQIDSKPPKYYRHSIGEPTIVGRNFNIALRANEGADFNDVGNLIVLESAGRPLGVELALGATTIAKELLSLSHVLDCTPIPDFPETLPPSLSRSLQDVVITSVVLYREGLRPSSRNNRTRLLREYLEVGIELTRRSEVGLEVVMPAFRAFEQSHFPEPYVSDDICADIESLLVTKKASVHGD